MNKVQITSETAGDGPPLILTHGLGDDMSTWDSLWHDLTRSFTVTRWDLRGHGSSDAPDDPAGYGPDIATADLLSLIGKQHAPVILVGHSLGGYLSLAVALRQPALVSSLVMISSGPGYRDPASRQRWNDYVDDVVDAMPIPNAARTLAHQHDSSVIDGLVTLACPLTQIVGERDTRFHAGVRYVASKVAKSETHIIPGAKHHPQRSHPELVVTLMGSDRVV